MFKKHRERRLGDFIPWVAPISDDVRLLSDHSALAGFVVDGVPHENVDHDLLAAAHNRLNLTWRNAGSDSLIATVYQCRGDVSPSDYPGGRFRSAFAESLDMAYRDGLYGRSLYENKTFLFLQVRPARPAGQWVGDKLDKRRPAARIEDVGGDGRDAEEERVRRLNQACDLIAADLAAYGVRRLGAVQRGPAMYCEMAEALAYAMTGVWRAVPFVTGHMGHAVLSEYVVFGRETIELRGPGRTDYVAMLAMQAYPAQYWPGQFDQLLAANYRYTAVHSIRWMSQAEGVAILGRKQNYMVTAGDKAASQIAELSVAADQAQSGKFIMGDHHFALAVFADSVRALRGVATAAWQDLADAGVKVAREGLANQAAYLSLVPGNADLRVRPGAISSRAFAAFCPFHAYPSGPERGHWGKPLMACRTKGGTLYRLHLHWAESGNVFVTGRTRSGKAQPLDAKVLTPTGWRRMGDLTAGDLVTCPDGKVTPITGVFPQGEKDIYRITFEDGRSTECCADHLWKVWWHGTRREAGRSHATRKAVCGARWQVKSLAEIMAVRDAGQCKAKRLAVPTVVPYAVEAPPQELPVPPYALGALLGDGSFRRGRLGTAIKFTSADADILARLGEALPDYELVSTGANRGLDYRLRQKVRTKPSPLRVALETLGVLGLGSHEKFIPEVYFQGSVAQRLALLQGLLDTDGSVGNGTHATFASTSKALAEGVQRLAWSLGGIAKIMPRQTHYRSTSGERLPGKPSWRVSIIHPDVASLFSLPRKVATCKPNTKNYRLRITGIEPIGRKPAQCISVDHPDQLYVTDDYIVTHNTTYMAFVIGQAEKYGARVVVGDKDRGLELAVRAYGGSYARLRNGEPCVAPLKALDGDNPGDTTFLFRLFLGLIRHGNTYETTPEDERRLALGLRAVMALSPEDRWVEDVAAFLPNSDPKGAKPRLMRWAWGRELGWIIDGPKHLLDTSKPVIGFDQTDVLDNADARGPILSTIFHVTEKLLTGDPVVWVLDEVWKSLLDEQFAPIIHDYLKTRGKFNNPIILGTQSPKDALNSPIAHTIVEQCGSMAHFANPKARSGGYGAGGLGMSDEKVATVASLQPGSGYFLWEQGPDSVVLQMPLHGLDDEIAVLSGKKETVKHLDAMSPEVLADPARMLAAFHAARKQQRLHQEEIVS